MHRLKVEGQAFIEFILTSGVLVALAAGAAEICRAEWRRTECLRLAFETAHRARIGRPALSASGVWIAVEPVPGGFRGMARCGTKLETADLPTLEGGQW